MDVSIIIVSWRVRNFLKRCLETIYHETQGVSFEVFVVDNNSPDGTVEMVRTDFPRVQLIANNSNVGFSRANNQAIKKAHGRFVLLLNPDTEIKDNAIGEMVTFMSSSAEVGISGCQMLNADESIQPSVRHFPTFCAMAMLMLKLHHVFPRARAMRHYLASDFDYTRQQPVDQVMGAFLMIRSEVIKRIGLLDEHFYIWFEEVDFCERAKEAGFVVMYVPQAQVMHHFGQSFKQLVSIRKQRIFNQSLEYYFKKHRSGWAYYGLLIIHPISLLLAGFSSLFVAEAKNK